MKLTLYQIDAFTDRLFGGNPAAVIPLEEWLSEELMQQIALENNLSETVFFVPAPASNAEADFEIRWFTPAVEINLCGHATLASAFVLFNYLDFKKPEIRFSSKSGILKVTRVNAMIQLDFPSWRPTKSNEDVGELERALGGTTIKDVYKNRDLLLELENEAAVKNCIPDFSLIKRSGYKIIITAAGDTVDFVSRFFAPGAGVDEDPVTGSAHSQLIPFWSDKLNKTSLTALQLSPRGGQLQCAQKGDRVLIAGNCVFYMKGVIEM
jgi:PhzF family phenazine biosynthesis protein